MKIYIWTLYSKLLISPLPVFKTPIFGFSSELIVSKSGEKAPNVVYKGKLQTMALLSLSTSPSSPGLTHINLCQRLVEWGRFGIKEW